MFTRLGVALAHAHCYARVLWLLLQAVAAAALKEAADKKAADVVQFAHLRKRLDADRPGPPVSSLGGCLLREPVE